MAVNGADPTQQPRPSAGTNTQEPSHDHQKYKAQLAGQEIEATPKGGDRWEVAVNGTDVKVAVRSQEQIGPRDFTDGSYLKEAVLRQAQGLPGTSGGQQVQAFQTSTDSARISAEPVSGANDSGQRLWEVTVERTDAATQTDTKATAYVTKQGQFSAGDLLADNTPANEAVHQQLQEQLGKDTVALVSSEVDDLYQKFEQRAEDGLGFNESPKHHAQLRDDLSELEQTERRDFYQKAIADADGEQLRELHELLQGATGSGTERLSEFRDVLTSQATANERSDFIETLQQDDIAQNSELAKTVGEVVRSLDGESKHVAKAYDALTRTNADNSALETVLEVQPESVPPGRNHSLDHGQLNDLIEVFSDNLDDSNRLARVFEATVGVIDGTRGDPNAQRSTMVEAVKLLAQNDTQGIVSQLRTSSSETNSLDTLFKNALEDDAGRVVGTTIGLIRGDVDQLVGEFYRADNQDQVDSIYDNEAERAVSNLGYAGDSLDSAIGSLQAETIRDAGSLATGVATAAFVVAPYATLATGLQTAPPVIAALSAGSSSEVIRQQTIGDVDSLEQLKTTLYETVVKPVNPEILKRNDAGDVITDEVPTRQNQDGELVYEERKLHEPLNVDTQFGLEHVAYKKVNDEIHEEISESAGIE